MKSKLIRLINRSCYYIDLVICTLSDTYVTLLVDFGGPSGILWTIYVHMFLKRVFGARFFELMGGSFTLCWESPLPPGTWGAPRLERLLPKWIDEIKRGGPHVPA